MNDKKYVFWINAYVGNVVSIQYALNCQNLAFASVFAASC